MASVNGFFSPSPSKLLRHFAILSPLLPFSAAGTFSITEFPAFSVARQCVQGCIYSGLTNGAPPLPWSLSCKSPYADSCVCRTDLAGSASSMLADCVSSACSDSPPDITSAQLLYGSYCASSLPTVSALPTYSIADQQAFSDLRGCAQDCLYTGPTDGSGGLSRALQCWGTAYDGCMCKTDQASTAASFLTKCVSKWCSGNVGDISDAVGAYTAYCAGAMNPAATTAATGGGAASTGAGVSSGPKATANSAKVTGSASTSNPTASPLSTAKSSGKGGLSTGAIAGIIVSAICSIVVASITIYLRCIRHKKKMQVLETQVKNDVTVTPPGSNGAVPKAWGR